MFFLRNDLYCFVFFIRKRIEIFRYLTYCGEQNFLFETDISGPLAHGREQFTLARIEFAVKFQKLQSGVVHVCA